MQILAPFGLKIINTTKSERDNSDPISEAFVRVPFLGSGTVERSSSDGRALAHKTAVAFA